MLNLTIKVTGNELYDRVAIILDGKVGQVTGSPFTGGSQFYNAVFDNYGEVTWIPAECCEVTDVSEPEAPTE